MQIIENDEFEGICFWEDLVKRDEYRRENNIGDNECDVEVSKDTAISIQILVSDPPSTHELEQYEANKSSTAQNSSEYDQSKIVPLNSYCDTSVSDEHYIEDEMTPPSSAILMVKVLEDPNSPSYRD